jgi:hypothetical protein
MSEKPTYWVRSKQPNEIGVFGRRPVPARFNKLEDAKQYRRELNLRKGPFHPGYVIEEQVSLSAGFFWNSKKRDRWFLNGNSSGGAMPVAITSRLVSGVVIADVTGRLCFLEAALRDQVNELTVHKQTEIPPLAANSLVQRIFSVAENPFATSRENIYRTSCSGWIEWDCDYAQLAREGSEEAKNPFL